MRLAALLLLSVAGLSPAADVTVKISAPMYFFPPVKKVVVTAAGASGPTVTKYVALAEMKTLTGEIKFSAAGNVDVWIVPKDGMPMRAVTDWRPVDKAELKLADHLGVIRVRGDDLPRGKLIVTDHQDRGPEDKRHKAVQWAGDSRTSLIVPPGDYAVWIAPDSGARARRITEKVRVLPGRSVDAD